MAGPPPVDPGGYQYDATGYQDPSEGGKEGFGVRHYVFKDNLRVRQPGRGDDDRTYLHIMPDFGDITNPHSWFWYRFKSQDGTWRFTQWMRHYFVWEFVGGRVHIISPKTFDPNAVDPVQLVYDKCRSTKGNAVWQKLIGNDPATGKRNEHKDALQDRKLQFMSTKYVINAVNTAKVHEGESNLSCLYTLSRTAVYGATDDNAPVGGGGWGLIAQLNQAQRRAADAPMPQDYDFDAMYYWGDITRADRNLPVMVFKSPPPTGSKAVKLYNCVPMQDVQPVHVPLPWLESRTPLRTPNLFVDYEQEEVLNRLETVLAGISTDLLIASFEGMIPNYRQRLNDKFGMNSTNAPAHPVGGHGNQQWTPGGFQGHGGGAPGGAPQGGYVPPGAPAPGSAPQGQYVPPGGAQPAPQGQYVPPGASAPPQAPQGHWTPPGAPQQPPQQAPYVPPQQQPQQQPQQAPYVPPSQPQQQQAPYVPPGHQPPPQQGYVPPGGAPAPTGHHPPAQVPLPTAPPQQAPYVPQQQPTAPPPQQQAPYAPPTEQPAQPAAPTGAAPVQPGVGAAGTAASVGDIANLIQQGMQGVPGAGAPVPPQQPAQ